MLAARLDAERSRLRGSQIASRAKRSALARTMLEKSRALQPRVEMRRGKTIEFAFFGCRCLAVAADAALRG